MAVRAAKTNPNATNIAIIIFNPRKSPISYVREAIGSYRHFGRSSTRTLALIQVLNRRK